MEVKYKSVLIFPRLWRKPVVLLFSGESRNQSTSCRSRLLFLVEGEGSGWRGSVLFPLSCWGEAVARPRSPPAQGSPAFLYCSIYCLPSDFPPPFAIPFWTCLLVPLNPRESRASFALSSLPKRKAIADVTSRCVICTNAPMFLSSLLQF